MTRAGAALLSLILACAACTAVDEIVPAEGEHAAAIASGRAITYTNSAPRAGDLAQLVLRVSRAYQATRVVVCVTTPCDPVEERGVYRLYRRPGSWSLDLSDERGTLRETYQVVFSGETLFLRRGTEERWQRMERR